MIETEKGRADITRFTIDVAIRLGLIATVIDVSLLLLQPVAALMMWAWQEYDVAAIARELGIADNAAHQLLFRARTRLKALLAGETDDD